MKPAWIAFHFVMVLMYLGVGGIFLFTQYLPAIKGTPRIILGVVFIIYALYRGYFNYRNFNR